MWKVGCCLWWWILSLLIRAALKHALRVLVFSNICEPGQSCGYFVQFEKRYWKSLFFKVSSFFGGRKFILVFWIYCRCWGILFYFWMVFFIIFCLKKKKVGMLFTISTVFILLINHKELWKLHSWQMHL